VKKTIASGREEGKRDANGDEGPGALALQKEARPKKKVQGKKKKGPTEQGEVLTGMSERDQGGGFGAEAQNKEET